MIQEHIPISITIVYSNPQQATIQVLSLQGSNHIRPSSLHQLLRYSLVYELMNDSQYNQMTTHLRIRTNYESCWLEINPQNKQFIQKSEIIRWTTLVKTKNQKCYQQHQARNELSKSQILSDNKVHTHQQLSSHPPGITDKAVGDSNNSAEIISDSMQLSQSNLDTNIIHTQQFEQLLLAFYVERNNEITEQQLIQMNLSQCIQFYKTKIVGNNQKSQLFDNLFTVNLSKQEIVVAPEVILYYNQLAPSAQQLIIAMQVAVAYQYIHQFKIIFDHYCQLSYKNEYWKSLTFEQIGQKKSLMTMHQFMIFSKDFNILGMRIITAKNRKRKGKQSIDKKTLMQAHKRNSVLHKQMSLDLFMLAIIKLGLLVFQHVNPKDSRTVDLMIDHLQLKHYEKFVNKLSSLGIKYRQSEIMSCFKSLYHHYPKQLDRSESKNKYKNSAQRLPLNEGDDEQRTKNSPFHKLYHKNKSVPNILTTKSSQLIERKGIEMAKYGSVVMKKLGTSLKTKKKSVPNLPVLTVPMSENKYFKPLEHNNHQNIYKTFLAQVPNSSSVLKNKIIGYQTISQLKNGEQQEIVEKDVNSIKLKAIIDNSKIHIKESKQQSHLQLQTQRRRNQKQFLPPSKQYNYIQQQYKPIKLPHQIKQRKSLKFQILKEIQIKISEPVSPKIQLKQNQYKSEVNSEFKNSEEKVSKYTDIGEYKQLSLNPQIAAVNKKIIGESIKKDSIESEKVEQQITSKVESQIVSNVESQITSKVESKKEQIISKASLVQQAELQRQGIHNREKQKLDWSIESSTNQIKQFLANKAKGKSQQKLVVNFSSGHTEEDIVLKKHLQMQEQQSLENNKDLQNGSLSTDGQCLLPEVNQIHQRQT